MSKLQIRGKDIRAIGYPEGPVISMAIHAMSKYYRHHTLDEALHVLQQVLADPKAYLEDEALGKVAAGLMPPEPTANAGIALNNDSVHFNVFGAEYIEQGAFEQMATAAKLPIAVAGALMPDAHHGYGLPIGGVLATDGAIIPYGVGVDIGCRMCLSIFDVDPAELDSRQSYFSRELNEATLFGSGASFTKPVDDPVLDRSEFNRVPMLRALHDKAWKQLGSSGSGNHFAEFGIVDIPLSDAIENLSAGKYLGLLTHSGSRGLGATIAGHYTQVAKQKRQLPKEAANLAWLNLDEEEGMEYWLAMNLAGDYASACHHVIHTKIALQLGRQPLKMIENHHNFAWKETFEGREVIVHRKGATPAGKNVLGIIPGSMTAPGYIVQGKGENASINSASHGAGRKMSRTAALSSITNKALREELERHQVKLIGGGLDEAPFAYKDINAVMQSQKQLVDTVGSFVPRIVKMAGPESRHSRKVPKGNITDGE